MRHNRQDISDQALAVLVAMRGRLFGRLDGNAPFGLEPGWSGPVPRTVANELHDAGLIEIDETAPISGTYVFRISSAGVAFLVAMPASAMSASHRP